MIIFDTDGRMSVKMPQLQKESDCVDSCGVVKNMEIKFKKSFKRYKT